MRWDSKEFDGDEHKVVLDLLAMRQNDILKKGEIQVRADGDLATITRKLDGKQMTLVVNHSGKDVPLEGNPTYAYNCKGGVMRNNSFAVYAK